MGSVDIYYGEWGLPKKAEDIFDLYSDVAYVPGYCFIYRTDDGYTWASDGEEYEYDSLEELLDDMLYSIEQWEEDGWFDELEEEGFFDDKDYDRSFVDKVLGYKGSNLNESLNNNFDKAKNELDSFISSLVEEEKNRTVPKYRDEVTIEDIGWEFYNDLKYVKNLLDNQDKSGLEESKERFAKVCKEYSSPYWEDGEWVHDAESDYSWEKGFYKTLSNICATAITNGKSNFEEDMTRYSDAYDDNRRKKGWWYFTTHGLGPGAQPKDLNVLEVRNGRNRKGTWGCYVRVDGILSTSELNQYDWKELTPDKDATVDWIDESLNEDDKFYIGDKEFNSRMLGRLISDCDYVLGTIRNYRKENPNSLGKDRRGDLRQLWSKGDIDAQVDYMLALYDALKPKGIDRKEIESYRKRLYDYVNGLDESLKEDLSGSDREMLKDYFLLIDGKEYVDTIRNKGYNQIVKAVSNKFNISTEKADTLVDIILNSDLDWEDLDEDYSRPQYSSTIFICQLPQSTQDKIRAELESLRDELGLTDENIEDAMNGRLVHLSDNIDISKYMNESLTEDYTDDIYTDYQSIEEYMNENGFSNFDLVNVERYPLGTTKISFEVEGDWKHDHLFFKNLLREWAEEKGRDIFKIDETEIGESDSDYYTAEYNVFIAKDRDAYNTLNSMRSLFTNESLKEELLNGDDSFYKAEDGCYYKLVDKKSVLDSDDFLTDYCMYIKACPDGSNFKTSYICTFGDKNLHRPEESGYDFETNNIDEAEDWFNKYGIDPDYVEESVMPKSELQQIRERLNELDLESLDNGETYYDLRNLFEATTANKPLTPEERQELNRLINTQGVSKQTISDVIFAKSCRDNNTNGVRPPQKG